MLAGVMHRIPMRGEILSYEAPSAYATGMIVAAFEPASGHEHVEPHGAMTSDSRHRAASSRRRTRVRVTRTNHGSA